MAVRDRLEIIRSDGVVEFLELNPLDEIINIGRDGSNQLIIDSAGIAPFHAILDRRQRPYRLLVLSDISPTTIGSQVVASNTYRDIQVRDTVEFGGNIVILMESEIIAPTAPAPEAGPEGIQPQAAPVVPQAEDELDEIIVTEFGQREATTNVEQTVSFSLTIINGGAIVAAFEVAVEGLDAEWVKVTPGKINLNEGQRGEVVVSITPPRKSSSYAGVHTFNLVVTSPNYPGRFSKRWAKLTVRPYFSFIVGDLMPKQQTVSWFRRYGETSLVIANEGNGESPFRVEGADDERAFTFELELPGEKVLLATKAEFRLKPDEIMDVHVRMTPRSRRLIGFQSRSQAVTVTTTQLEGEQTSRMLLGQVKLRPLIGFLEILLFLLLIAGVVGYAFWPRLEFEATPKSVTAGQEVLLTWESSTLLVDLKLDGVSINSAQTSTITRPIKTTAYKMTADSWLSKLLPLTQTRIEEVTVRPVKPDILLFEAQPMVLTAVGQPAILSWLVVDADTVTLINQTDPAEEKLPKPYGTKELALKKDTSYLLRAVNNSMPDQPVEKPISILIQPPIPVIAQFSVQPEKILTGQSVVVTWRVEKTDKVNITPLGDSLPPNGNVVAKPGETMLYILTATNGKDTVREVRQVVVSTPPPPAPPPVIDLFKANPESSDGGTTARLDWVVSGPWTRIELTDGSTTWSSDKKSPNYDEAIKGQGNKSFSISETTTYTLKAFNGATAVVKTAMVTINPPPAPEVATFTVTPESTPATMPVDITLNWMISGSYTKIELSDGLNTWTTDAGANNPANHVYYDATLTRQGWKMCKQIPTAPPPQPCPRPTQTTVYSLTIWNGPTKVVKTVTFKIQ